MSYALTLSQDKLVINSTTTANEVSLSRTGGQGTKGDSITSVYNLGNELIIEISNSAGEIVETINAGSFIATGLFSELEDINFTSLNDGDYVAYDLNTSKFVNHRLTTSKITDIDNTNKTDGSLLVYNGVTEKYTATNTLSNQNTNILGGTF